MLSLKMGIFVSTAFITVLTSNVFAVHIYFLIFFKTWVMYVSKIHRKYIDKLNKFLKVKDKLKPKMW